MNKWLPDVILVDIIITNYNDQIHYLSTSTLNGYMRTMLHETNFLCSTGTSNDLTIHNNLHWLDIEDKHMRVKVYYFNTLQSTTNPTK